MIPAVPGMSALDMNAAEDAVVAGTRELVPGMVISFDLSVAIGLCLPPCNTFSNLASIQMRVSCGANSIHIYPVRNPVSLKLTQRLINMQVVCGMEVAEHSGAPRMGPTFGEILCMVLISSEFSAFVRCSLPQLPVLVSENTP